MDIKELREKSAEDLKVLLSESRQQLTDLEFKTASGQLKEVRKIRNLKKTIAQTLTLLNKK